MKSHPKKASCMRSSMNLKSAANRRQKESPEEIVHSAYKKFGRGKFCRKAVGLCFGVAGGYDGITQEGGAA